jgi:hypothetical protein
MPSTFAAARLRCGNCGDRCEAAGAPEPTFLVLLPLLLPLLPLLFLL